MIQSKCKLFVIIIGAITCFCTNTAAQDNFISNETFNDKSSFSFPLKGGGSSAKNIVHFTISGGVSQLVNRVEDDDAEREEYLKDLRRGFYFQTDASYALSDYFSVGVKYNFHKSSNELTDVTFTDVNGNTIVGSISNDISISFIGVGLNGRLISESEKNIFNAGLSIGTINYADDEQQLSTTTIDGNTIGMLYNFGYEYAVNERVGVGFSFNYSFGTITKVKRNGMELSSGEDFNIGTGRIQLGIIGLFHF